MHPQRFGIDNNRMMTFIWETRVVFQPHLKRVFSLTNSTQVDGMKIVQPYRMQSAFSVNIFGDYLVWTLTLICIVCVFFIPKTPTQEIHW
jgi:hypothetical protein